MQEYIVDASIGVKWFFDEEWKEKADLLIRKAKQGELSLIVPEIFYSEVGNACWKKVRRKALVWEDAVAILDRVIGLPLERYSDHELSDVALENALHYKISIYDALYLSLAEIYVAPLITADRALLEACRKRFEFIEALWDLEF